MPGCVRFPPLAHGAKEETALEPSVPLRIGIFSPGGVPPSYASERYSSLRWDFGFESRFLQRSASHRRSACAPPPLLEPVSIG